VGWPGRRTQLAEVGTMAAIGFFSVAAAITIA